jgi:predicted TIM-barrel fold metal-dependent hydrolase
VNGQLIVDADGHVRESDREIFAYLPEPYAGKEALFAASFFPTLDGFHRAATKVLDGKGRAVANPSGADWLAYLDETNIAVSVLFPTAGLGFGLIQDPNWAEALARGYNAWLYDRFLRANPRRLKGMALLPLQDPPRAAAELRRTVGDLGMVGGILPATGLSEAFGHRSFWPVYEAAQELNCVLAVHGASLQGLGLERLRRLIEARTLSHGFSQMVQITSMMFGGVFDAFPRLRVAFCEAGSGWAPYVMERLDLEWENRGAQAPEIAVPPSAHLQSGRVYVHAELKERGLATAVQALGGDVFFAASDFPHEPKHEFLENLAYFEARPDVPAEVKRKILWDNPIRMYALDEADVRAAASQPAAATAR